MTPGKGIQRLPCKHILCEGCTLDLMRMDGRGVCPLCRAPCPELEGAEGMYKQAKMLYEQHIYHESFKKFAVVADLNPSCLGAEAMVRMAVMCREGKGCEQSLERAFKMFTKAHDVRTFKLFKLFEWIFKLRSWREPGVDVPKRSFRDAPDPRDALPSRVRQCVGGRGIGGRSGGQLRNIGGRSIGGRGIGGRVGGRQWRHGRGAGHFEPPPRGKLPVRDARVQVRISLTHGLCDNDCLADKF